MIVRKWEKLPERIRSEKTRPYYELLRRKTPSLIVKRLFDLLGSSVLIVILSPAMLAIALWIRMDSKGPAIFRQKRITQYGRTFEVYKFRTMVSNAEQLGAQITSGEDSRITRVGKKLRGLRLDELPQLFNVLEGTMTFVGTRPEVPGYVECYSEEMMATLLLPAGITSKASILFRDESRLLENSSDIHADYINKVLPKKMQLNLEALKEFSCIGDMKIMLSTIKVIFGK
ncbi:glycosyl transferase [Hornefia porci]|uniref:Glycosyl transferase n=1 Tax=Hornefia porci TaxID=2652292 RepID=A0A1Q9JEV7_9FIRM|nr:sugar transferase [Hornefia porci]OLR54772.1 glycosyl transferase [Hornefia porci]